MPKPERVVLDSYALLAFLFQEEGCREVLHLFERAVDTGTRHLITSVNWAEVRYIIARRLSPARWVEVNEELTGLPLEIVTADKDLAESAGEIKATGGMSLADCFAAALARKYKLPLCTGDPEFRSVQSEIQILWL